MGQQADEVQPRESCSRILNTIIKNLGRSLWMKHRPVAISFSEKNNKNTETPHVYLSGFKVSTPNFESHKTTCYSVSAVACNTLQEMVSLE